MKKSEIKNIIKEEIKKLNESGLSRIWEHSQKHDTAYITAFRNEYTKRENLDRNKSLKMLLKSNGYGITKVRGSYIENYKTSNAVEVGESTFFVVDLKDTGGLRKVIIKYGKHFNQDSVLFVDKGARISYLIGTNHSEYPGWNVVIKQKEAVFGKTGEFMTRINGRPFIFRESVEEITSACNIMSQRSYRVGANILLREIGLKEV